MKLELSPTLSLPTADEMPKHVDVAALDAERASARIEPGYVVQSVDPPGPFTFFARCNVDNSRLWNAFETLAAALPGAARALVGERGDYTLLLSERSRDAALRVFHLYEKELTRGTYLECGLIHEVEGKTEKLFLCGAKYLAVWGNDLAGFRRSMAVLGLEEIPELRFVDEFPLVSRPLWRVEPGTLEFDVVVDEIEERLGGEAAD